MPQMQPAVTNDDIVGVLRLILNVLTGIRLDINTLRCDLATENAKASDDPHGTT